MPPRRRAAKKGPARRQIEEDNDDDLQDDEDLLGQDNNNMPGNDQEELTPDERDEVHFKVLTSANPQAPHNLMKFSWKERNFICEKYGHLSLILCLLNIHKKNLNGETPALISFPRNSILSICVNV